MSPTRTPALTVDIPSLKAFFVSFNKCFTAPLGSSPTTVVTAESTIIPSHIITISKATTSPASKGIEFGAPCTTQSLTDIQTTPGKFTSGAS